MVPVMTSKVLFTPDECRRILNYQNTYVDLIYRKLEPHIDLENRRVFTPRLKTTQINAGKYFYVYDIPNDEETNWFFNRAIDYFTQETGVKLNPHRPLYGASLHRYTKGDYFSKHIDIDEEFSSRRYNIGIHLNNDYEGGDYYCWDHNKNETIFSKEPGTVLIYTGDYLHEITEITSGERWSIVMPIHENNLLEKKPLL